MWGVGWGGFFLQPLSGWGRSDTHLLPLYVHRLLNSGDDASAGVKHRTGGGGANDDATEPRGPGYRRLKADDSALRRRVETPET